MPQAGSKAFPQAIVPTGDNPNNPNNFSYEKLSDSYDVVRADVAKDNANNANNFSYEEIVFSYDRVRMPVSYDLADRCRVTHLDSVPTREQSCT